MHPDQCDDCTIINGDLIQCEACIAYEARMQALYGTGTPEALRDASNFDEPDWDFELKYRRENA